MIDNGTCLFARRPGPSAGVVGALGTHTAG
jgi:hypothetical protein